MENFAACVRGDPIAAMPDTRQARGRPMGAVGASWPKRRRRYASLAATGLRAPEELQADAAQVVALAG
ncbi:hypothetical protein D5S18_29185 [Nocardia panacis]|uniref:Uncharacterized protein n=1 Tax=Nocardia panacis TaxID=2340916 RepID=A0A3A4K9B2_9NOCA|nr:hypothetical protein D5S18_29185 [Nocardia panacis]